MAENVAAQSLMTGLLDPTYQTNQKTDLKRRRFRRCKSAPLAEFVPGDFIGTGSLPRSESIFDSIHPSFRKVAIYLAVYLGIGTVCFSIVRHQIQGKKTNGILDSVYFCIVTMTTVGYGDLVPNSTPTKLLACAFVFSGMALFGLILSKAADYLVEKQEILLVKALHIHQKVGPTEILKEIEINKVRYKCFMVLAFLLVLIIAGTIFLVTVEKLDLVDAFYCVCCTITTLGYGDKSFSTKRGRVFAIFWILTSTICLALFFLYLAELNTESRQRALVILKEIEINKVRYKCFMVLAFLLVLIIAGTIFLVTVEKLDLVDAFYCVCCTITTLGYGDKSFSTKRGRVFAIFWIVTSTICLALFFLYLAELNTESRQRALAKRILTKRVTNQDLEVADIDNDGDVGAAEFILYKLKEMGKIKQEDISLVMEEFENLDVDQSGTLSASDIILAQSSPPGSCR
ncbi:unnamed protein product [Ilex paraguariensis]|uniref:Potassium channel domain-containing protein n=1 Tax=Ilex paraguariensis TaxID=185542 RepID=A0ABC8TG95_9AQUA